MRYPFFGISPDKYDIGINPTIAINATGKVVAIHHKEGGLFWNAGRVTGTTLTWTGSGGDKRYDHGFSPSVAVRDDVILQVHDSGGPAPDCWYWTGRFASGGIVWADHDKYDGGREPAVSVNAGGVVVEVHNREVGTPLFWRLGKLDGTKLSWTDKKGHEFASGFHASVSVNASGRVIVTYDLDWRLYYRIGQVTGGTIITWHDEVEYDKGANSSVVLTDDDYVFEVHQSDGVPPLVDGRTVWQRVGRIKDGLLEWCDVFGNGQKSNYYDDGETPQMASNGKQAVQTHKSENFDYLHANACLVIDRASWMQDNIKTLGSKSLSQIAVPASHDAAMYLGGFDFALLGKTQDLDLYGQLRDGVRYFDLRPEYARGKFFLYHGPIQGPPLADVLAQINRFLEEDHRELIVLKFSHFKGFKQAVFDQFCQLVAQCLDTWLYTDKPSGTRLAQISLDKMIADAGVTLVVYDSDGKNSYVPPEGTDGFYVYRDWYADDPEVADLTVFDIYSNTVDFDVMAYSEEPDREHPSVPRGQLPKFSGFTGKCQKNTKVPCDLFLLSWTLTPPTAVWTVARIADKHLVDNMADVGANAYGRVINMLYVDYAEYARATDVAFVRNGLLK